MRQLFLLLTVLYLAGCGEDLTVRSFLKNREAANALRAETPDLAVLALTEALASSPLQPELHVNLGLALHLQKKGDEAIGSLKAAEALARDREELFAARYNLGVIYSEAKKIDEALFWYQKALEVDPASIPVKTNIELLVKSQQQQQSQGEGDQQQDKSNGGGKGESKNDSQKEQQKDSQENQNQDQKQKDRPEDQPRQYQAPSSYKPREFKGELHEADVKKILGEIKQQEQRIRSEYNRRNMKEQARDKDW